MYTVFLYSALTTAILFLLTFFISLIIKDNSIADIIWGLGFITSALTSFFVTQTFYITQIIATILILIWGIRLATHIYIRNKGRSEDFRYKSWREKWGKNVLLKSFLQVYLIQWFFLQIIASSFVLINSTKPIFTNNYLLLFGVLIWLIGFLFESVGDYQLLIFKRNPNNKGKIMKYGVWKYTRHPNYFGEATLWWGIFIIALMHPMGIITIISPLLINYLLLFVSGIPMLEKKYKGNKEFEEYKKNTSAFFPLPTH